MNSSLLTADRTTHLKIGLTALLATALVFAVGIFANPVGGNPVTAARPFAVRVVATAAIEGAPQIR